jgi:hypothetical protein
MASRRDFDGEPVLSGAFGFIRPGLIARFECADRSVAFDLKRTMARL